MPLDPSIFDEIAANRTDPEPQLVVATALLEAGDPREELIALDHQDRNGAAMSPFALERLLTLAALHGFPDPTDAPPASLPWQIRSTAPVDCEVTHEGTHYHQQTDESCLAVRELESGSQEDVGYGDELDEGGQLPKTAGELAVVLGSIGDAILAGTPLATLWFPYDRREAAGDHVPRRCYDVPSELHRLLDIRGNDLRLAARDWRRWFALWERLVPHLPRDRCPGWPGRRLPLFERRLRSAGVAIRRRVTSDPEHRLPSPAALHDAIVARQAREHDVLGLVTGADRRSTRECAEALELALGTLGRNASVLAVGMETRLAPDAPWFEITPAPGWLPRLMSTEPRHVLLLSADGTRTSFIRTAYQCTHETFPHMTAALLGP